MAKIDDLIDPCRTILRQVATSRGTITYGALADRLGLAGPRQQWSLILHRVYEMETTKGGRDITLVVVNKATRISSWRVYNPATPANVTRYLSDLAEVHDHYSR